VVDDDRSQIDLWALQSRPAIHSFVAAPNSRASIPSSLVNIIVIMKRGQGVGKYRKTWVRTRDLEFDSHHPLVSGGSL